MTCPAVHARENDGRCLIVCRLDRLSTSWDTDVCLRVILKSVVVLSVGIPSVARTSAIWRGSDGVEDRLGCCLTLSFSFPQSPICLGNHAPRCREKRAGGGALRKIQLTEAQKLGEKRDPGEWTKHREGDRFQ